MHDATAARHPIVSTFAAFVESCLVLAARHPHDTFVASIAPEGAEVLFYANGGFLEPVQAMEGLSGHQRLVLAQDAFDVVARAHAWHQACSALPVLAPLIGTGYFAFHKGNVASFDWKPSCITKPGKHPFMDPVATDITLRLSILERGVDAALSPTVAPRELGVFDGSGTHKGKVHTDLGVARALLPLLFLHAHVHRNKAFAFVAAPEGRFTFFDVEHQAWALHAAYDPRPVDAFWDAVRRLNDSLVSPLPRPIMVLRLLAKDGKARVETVVDETWRSPPLGGGNGNRIFVAEGRYAHTIAPIQRLWEEAVALLPADGQWRHAGLKAMLPCKNGTEPIPPRPLTSANLTHHGKNGWTSTNTHGTHGTHSLGQRATGRPYLVALVPGSTALRVDASDPRAAVATAIAAYSGDQTPQAYSWPRPIEVWSVLDA